MSTTVAGRIIDFLGALQGMDRLQAPAGGPRRAVIDLTTGATIEAHPDFPDGAVLLYERAGGPPEMVSTRKLTQSLFVRHAFQLSVLEGGAAKDHCHYVTEHFHLKTGFGK